MRLISLTLDFRLSEFSLFIEMQKQFINLLVFVYDMNLVNLDMGKCIVILEDEKATLEMMEMALEDEGYDVIAINHHEPPEYIIDFAPQLILLDVRLSNGYGHLLCEDLKKNPRTSKIPVILVSGAGNLEKIAKDCNANNYLSKPFDMDELLKITRKYI